MASGYLDRRGGMKSFAPIFLIVSIPRPLPICRRLGRCNPCDNFPVLEVSVDRNERSPR